MGGGWVGGGGKGDRKQVEGGERERERSTPEQQTVTCTVYMYSVHVAQVYYGGEADLPSSC